jgi:hypothetical protein
VPRRPGHGGALPGRVPGVNRARVGVACAVCALLAASAARAAPVRRIFEPTDMEFEEPGMAELDMEFGLVRGENAYRVSTPDFELDLGLMSNLELDVDGELAVAGPNDGTFTFDRFRPDNTWTALKVGLLDFTTGDHVWTAGVQLGPKLPTAHANRGVGGEGLVLLGWRRGEASLVVNLGGLLDPAPHAGSPRPAAFEGGIDLSLPLDADGRWALAGGLSGVRYVSPDNDQLNALLGVVWSPSDLLDLSLTVFGGPLDGGDRWGVLFGFSPKVRLW